MPSNCLFLVFVSLSLSLGVASGDDPFPYDCGESDTIDENPIGTCSCEHEVFVAENCTEGFYCLDLDGNGCQRVSKCFQTCPVKVKLSLFSEMWGRHLLVY